MRYANVTIRIRGNRAKLEGDFPITVVREATSYVVKGFQYQPRFKRGSWDGRNHFLTRPGNTCPAGLVPGIVQCLESWRDADPERSLQLKINDERHRPPPLGGAFDLNQVVLRDYQLTAAKAAVEAGRGVLKMATNSGKTATFAAILGYLGRPGLLVVPGLDLLYQTQTELSRFLGEEVGLIGDGQWNPRKYTVASPQSLTSDNNMKRARQYLKTLDIIGVDECHGAAAKKTYTIFRYCPAYYRFGMSGTPLDRTDEADMRLIAQTGEVICEVSNKDLVERGLSVPVEIEFIIIGTPVLPDRMDYQDVYKKGIVENEDRNLAIVKAVLPHIDKHFQAVVLVKELAHGQLLYDLFSEVIQGHEWINGTESTERRQDVIDRFKAGEVPVIIATNILNQGISIDNIDVLVNAAAGKSRINTLQRLGRGLRTGGNSDTLYLIEFGDMGHRYLADHSLARLKDYREEDCFKITRRWNAASVKGNTSGD